MGWFWLIAIGAVIVCILFYIMGYRKGYREGRTWERYVITGKWFSY